jgi:hypothetical protein
MLARIAEETEMTPVVALTLLTVHAQLGPHAQFRVDVPALEVQGVHVGKPGQCEVALRNVHGRPAVAWIVMDRDGSAGGATDRLLPTPDLWLHPQQSYTSTFPCRATNDADASQVVAIALYDDATVSGDDAMTRQAVDMRILRPRMRAATGLRIIAQLIQSRRLQSSDRRALHPELKETIRNIEGDTVSPASRATALNALDSLERELSSDVDIPLFRSHLVQRLSSAAAQLQIIQPDSGGY